MSSTLSAQHCLICANVVGNRIYHAREMFLGTRDPFDYLECSACGSLRLLDPPDLAPYYHDERYDLLAPTSFSVPKPLDRVVRTLRTELALRGFPVTRLRRNLADHSGVIEPVPHWLSLLRAVRASRDSVILDVGCGGGRFLFLLKRNGFRNLTGIDPFIAQSTISDGVRMCKGTIEDFIGGTFDLIFFNDSFEHVPDPRATLEAAAALLTPSGTIIIRTPVADSFAWHTYGVNWMALDPPRHLVIQTRASMAHLAEKTELGISAVIYDSQSLQFWGSEQYARDIPLVDERSPAFSTDTLRGWARKAAELNRKEQGDHATFLLRHA